MFVRVDEQLCQGTGYCVRLAPSVFRLEGGVARVLVADPGPELAERLEEAESVCPSGAISL